MKDTHFKTATQPFNRLAETGLQRLTLSTTHSRSAWGWALGLFLLCCGSMTGAWAQALSNPNGIDGIIEWNNNPSSAVYAHLTTAGNGLAVGTMYHNDLSFSLPGHTPITMITSPMSAKYEVQVQAGTSVGIQHNLSPQMFTAVWTYWFDTKLSAGVVNPPVKTFVPLDFSECAALVEVSFCTASGTPVTVSSGNIFAYRTSDGFQQAGGTFANVSSIKVPVRSGIPSI